MRDRVKLEKRSFNTYSEKFFLKKRLFLSLKVENKTKGKLQKQICQVVLDHFEKQYTAELGDKWTSVRSVLLGKRGREERGSVSF